MKWAIGCMFLVCVASTGAQSVADALRNASKPIALRELPGTYRAISIGSGDGSLSMSVMMAMSWSAAGREDPRQRLLASLFNATFVDPDEFAQLLDGKRPRIRAYVVDFLSTYGQMPLNNDNRKVPEPAFLEVWIEAGRIQLWSPRAGLDKATLIKAFSETAATASDRSEALSRAKQVALGFAIYSADYDDRLPPANSTDEAKKVVMPYVKSEEVWKSTNPAGGRFLFNTSLSKVMLTSIEQPASTLLLWDENPWPDGGRVTAYVDGHVKFVSGNEWVTAWSSEMSRRAVSRPQPKVALPARRGRG